MAELLKGFEDFAVPYLDEIAIFSNDWESHLEKLKLVLNRIAEAKLTLKPNKCKFAQNCIKYLGHYVGNGYRTPAEAKVQAVFVDGTKAKVVMQKLKFRESEHLGAMDHGFCI